MSKILNRALVIGGENRIVGTPAITVLEYDLSNNVYRAKGATVPTDDDNGYAVGCIFIDTSGGAGVTAYVNEGTVADCDFNSLNASGSGANTTLSNLGTVAINKDLDPGADGTIDLGNTGKEYKDIWIDGVAYLDSVMGDVAELGGATNYIKVADAGVLTMEGTATIDGVASGLLVDSSAAEVITGGWDFTTADVEIKADSIKLGFGTAGVSDSYVLFDGTSLTFYDTEVGSAKTLNDLLTGTSLNPSVQGDLTISDGKFNWTDAVNEIAGTWSFAHAGAGSDIDIATSATTGECIHIVADSITTGQVIDIETDGIGAAGALVYLDITVAGMDASGNFIECFNGAADVFEVGKYGAVTIAGNASGTDALTLNTGDIKVTSGLVELTLGNVLLTDGKIEVDVDSDLTTYIKKGFAGSAGVVLEVENTNATGTGYAMLITQAASSGASGGLSITNKGTSPILSLAAGAARTGYGLHIPAADQLAEKLILVNGAFTGAVDEGMVELSSTGVLAAGANLLRVVSSGANTAESYAVEITTSGAYTDSTGGASLRIDHTGTAASGTVYAAYINSTEDEALHIAAGEVLVDEYLTATLGLVTDYDDSQDLAATPTNANFDACFGVTSLGKAGFMGIAKDSGGTPVYFVTSDGTDWWYAAVTKAE